VSEIDCKPTVGHYTGAGDELDVEDLYTKYKVLQNFIMYYIFIIYSIFEMSRG